MVVCLGGDEFVLVLICVEDESWCVVVDWVVQVLGEFVELVSGIWVMVGVMVGVIVVVWDEVVSLQEFIVWVDYVMLCGKWYGKGRVFVQQGFVGCLEGLCQLWLSWLMVLVMRLLMLLVIR